MTKTTTYRSGRDTFCIREATGGGFNVYYLLKGRGAGQMTWIGKAATDKPADLNAAIARGRRNGEF